MERSKRTILCMGPIVPPFTGQAVAFTAVVDELKKTNKCIVVDIANKDRWLDGVVLCFSIIVKVLFNKIDCIYFTCSRTKFGSIRDVVLLFCARLKNIRTINHLHGADYKLFLASLPAFYQKVIFWSYSYIDTGIVLLDEMCQEFDSYENMKIKVVHNFYGNTFDQLPTSKQIDINKKVHMLYFSNLMKTKGVLNLLDACKVLFSKYDSLYLSIAGEIYGDYELSFEDMKTEFNRKVEFLNVKYPGRLNYLGVCTGSIKNNLFWESDIFILPTYYITEAFPLTLIEAMRSGNYLITTNHNYLPHIMDSRFGELIEPNSIDSIVQSVENVYEFKCDLQTISNHNIKFAIENYSENLYLLKVLDIILEK